MIIPMQMIRLTGILFISLCPIAMSLYIYFSAHKRITAIKNVRANLEKILSLLSIKSGNFIDFNYQYLSSFESSQLKAFYDSLTTSNSSLITDDCNRLIKEFTEREKKEKDEFLQKGKIVVSTGASIGVTIFILLI